MPSDNKPLKASGSLARSEFNYPIEVDSLSSQLYEIGRCKHLMPEVVVDPAPVAVPAPVSGGGGSSSDTTTSSSGGSSVSNQNPDPGYIPRLEVVPLNGEILPAKQDREITNLFQVRGDLSIERQISRRFGKLKTVNFTLSNAINLFTNEIKSMYLVEDKETNTITNFIDPGHVLKQDPKAKIEFEDTNFYVNDITNVFDQLDSDEDGITKQVFGVYDQFGRFADPGGLKHHSDNIREGRSDLRSTIESFSISDEFKPVFSRMGESNWSSPEKIENIFDKSVAYANLAPMNRMSIYY